METSLGPLVPRSLFLGQASGSSRASTGQNGTPRADAWLTVSEEGGRRAPLPQLQDRDTLVVGPVHRSRRWAEEEVLTLKVDPKTLPGLQV